MNAIIAHPDFAAIPPEEDGPGSCAEHDPVFSPERQADFLASLQLGGNVRAACRVACVSAQTAYRARRASRAFSKAWDAALVAARDRAEEVLANRAIDGVEEPVFYHGEEIARRRRYSDRLLLAYLARLDRMAERPGAAQALAALDDQIDALRLGTPLAEPEPEQGQDPVPCVPSPPGSADEDHADGEDVEVVEAPDPPCRKCGMWCETPGIELDEEDCQYIFNRLTRMDHARPKSAPRPSTFTSDFEEQWAIEQRQLTAFEAGAPDWWLIQTEQDLERALAAPPSNPAPDATPPSPC